MGRIYKSNGYIEDKELIRTFYPKYGNIRIEIDQWRYLKQANYKRPYIYTVSLWEGNSYITVAKSFLTITEAEQAIKQLFSF